MGNSFSQTNKFTRKKKLKSQDGKKSVYTPKAGINIV